MPITANIASTAIQTAAMIAASRLWLSGQLQSTWGRWGSTSSPGSTPIVSAQARIAPATDRVQQRLDDQRRAQRRVRRPWYPVVTR